MSSLRVALRIAVRDALAHRLRSALVMVLVGLPVLVVTAGLVVLQTSEVNDAEALDRELGSADAYVQHVGVPVEQDFSPFRTGYWLNAETGSSIDGGTRPATGEVDTSPLVDVLGADTRLVPFVDAEHWFRAADGDSYGYTLREVDLRDEVAAGFFTLTEGRLPAGTDEVVVNEGLRAKGYDIGDVLPALGGRAPQVVGVGEDAGVVTGSIAYGLTGSLVDSTIGAGDEVDRGWLVQTGDVSWDDVEALNEAGFLVASRAVIQDPPQGSTHDFHGMYDEGFSDDDVANIGLVVVMVLLQLVLLAGPAFAVTARRQARTLALVATAGGTPAQARRVVVAQGAVLGLAASVVGTVLGLAAGAGVAPVFERFSHERFGPLEVPWGWVGGVALVGVLAVLLAAVFPAWVTARQDPVAALAGRRSDPSPRLRHPLVGLLLVAAGVASTAYAAQRTGDGSWLVTASTVVVVLGMVLVVPVLLVAVSKAVGGLPFAVRFAARDGARHRTRTVPAVVAVAATVAGVVALGTTVSSDTAQDERMYDPSLQLGATVVQWDGWGAPGDVEELTYDEAFERIEPIVTRVAGQQPEPVHGLLDRYEGGRDEAWLVLGGSGYEDSSFLAQSGHSYGTGVVVSDDTGLLVLDDEQADEAEAALAAGKVVVPTHVEVEADTVVLRHRLLEYGDGDEAEEEVLDEYVLPAHYLRMTGEFLDTPPMQALVPIALADDHDMPVAVTALHLRDGLDRAQEKALDKAFTSADLYGAIAVTERGFEDRNDTPLLLLVLGAGAWVLMLVGTLTAAFLALSDARGDLATLGAVGAEPRVRRRVAAAYAWVVAGLGAVLGAGIGLVPGVAMAVQQRDQVGEWYEGFLTAEPPLVVDVPWLLVLAVVVGLPLLTAAVMWVSARPRLPLVARVE